MFRQNYVYLDFFNEMWKTVIIFEFLYLKSPEKTPKMRDEETSPERSGKFFNKYTIPRKESSRLRPASSTLSILAKKPRLMASSKVHTYG